MAIDGIKDGALALPESDRAELAAALLASLGPEPDVDQRAVERSWAEELPRRATALDNGDDAGVAWEEAIAEARQDLTE